MSSYTPPQNHFFQNEWTPLMQASEEGHVDVVNVLFDYNAKANHQTNVIMLLFKASHPQTF